MEDLALAHAAGLPEREAVLDLFGAWLVSAPGRDALDGLRFLRDRSALEALHRRLAQACVWLERRGSFGFAGLPDPAPLLELARVPGAALAAMELLQVLRLLETVAALRDHAREGDGDQPGPSGWPAIAALAAAMPACDGLRRALANALLPTGEVADTASPALRRIRRERDRQRDAIARSLASHLRRLGDAGVLQDELITVRNDRYVVPVRAEQRGRAAGVVHGASSSGQTLFVEPLETIELNNEFIRLRDAEAAEVARILAALTASVGAEAAALARAAGLYGELELEMAKARFAREWGAVAVDFAPAGAARLELRDARHPVLESRLRRQGSAMVPLSLALDEDRVLVISGPNTGGKTVVLKTAGIAAWMAQCGLPVCAASGVLPVFDAVWADIGDAQSLELSLSTFSSHLDHIRRILAAAGPDTLVLLDELGTATNAAEGAALAEAIAEEFLSRRSWTFISTHHDSLKAWASSSPGAINASVGVDPDTLAPTFHFRLGVPGISAGLAMAGRIGLPAATMARARQLLSAQQQQAAVYLERLERLVAEAERREAAAAERQRETDANAAALAAREAAVERREQRDRQRDREAIRAGWERQFHQLEERLDLRWREALAALPVPSKRAAVEAARLRREAQEASVEALQAILPAPAPGARPAPQPEPGDRVRLRRPAGIGQVLRRIAGGYEVEIGRLRLQLEPADIEEVVPAFAAVKPEARPATAEIRELNLVGQRVEPALDELERFLDRALLAGLERVRIVHGFGAGALRRAVAEALRASPQVASFSHPPHNQGGEGVTLVELK